MVRGVASESGGRRGVGVRAQAYAPPGRRVVALTRLPRMAGRIARVRAIFAAPDFKASIALRLSTVTTVARATWTRSVTCRNHTWDTSRCSVAEC